MTIQQTLKSKTSPFVEVDVHADFAVYARGWSETKVDDEIRHFLKTSFPASYGRSLTVRRMGLPQDLQSLGYSTVPMVVVPDWSPETKDFASKVLERLFPAKVIALVTDPSVHPGDLMQVGFKKYEIAYPMQQADTARAMIAAYDSAYIPRKIEPFLPGQPANDDAGTAQRFNVAGTVVPYADDVRIGGLTFQPERGRVFLTADPERTVSLTGNESRFVSVLLNNVDRAVKKSDIYAALYDDKGMGPEMKILDVMKCKIVRKLETLDPSLRDVILPCWANGYVLSVRGLDKPFSAKEILGRSRAGAHMHMGLLKDGSRPMARRCVVN